MYVDQKLELNVVIAPSAVGILPPTTNPCRSFRMLPCSVPSLILELFHISQVIATTSVTSDT